MPESENNRADLIIRETESPDRPIMCEACGGNYPECGEDCPRKEP